MKWVSKFLIYISILLVIIWLNSDQAMASSLDEYDFSELNNWDEENNFDVDFSELANNLMQNDWNLTGVLDVIYRMFLVEVRECFSSVVLLAGIIVVSAVFKSATSVLESQSVAKMGAVFSYIVIMTILFHNFELAFDVATKTVENVMDFLYSLLPTFFCAVTFCGGVFSGNVLYQWTGLAMCIVNKVVIQLIVPMVRYYIILSLVNYASDEERFSNMCKLIKKIVILLNKITIGIVLGMNAVKTMTVPLTDSIKNTFFRKAIGSIPGIGNGVEGVVQTISGTGNLIKNSIGIAGLIVVVLIMVVPMCKLIAMNLFTHALAAVFESIADKKVIKGINAVADGMGILQYLVCTSSIIFIVMIGMICASTGGI